VVSFTHRPLYPKGKSPLTNWIGGWVGSRTVLDAVVMRKFPSPRRESNPRTPIVQPVAQRLYRLRYHGSCNTELGKEKILKLSIRDDNDNGQYQAELRHFKEPRLGYRPDDRDSIPDRVRYFPLATAYRPNLGRTHPLVQWTPGFFPRG
jgi:hypothetical protein